MIAKLFARMDEIAKLSKSVAEMHGALTEKPEFFRHADHICQPPIGQVTYFKVKNTSGFCGVLLTR